MWRSRNRFIENSPGVRSNNENIVLHSLDKRSFFVLNLYFYFHFFFLKVYNALTLIKMLCSKSQINVLGFGIYGAWLCLLTIDSLMHSTLLLVSFKFYFVVVCKQTLKRTLFFPFIQLIQFYSFIHSVHSLQVHFSHLITCVCLTIVDLTWLLTTMFTIYNLLHVGRFDCGEFSFYSVIKCTRSFIDLFSYFFCCGYFYSFRFS